MGAGQYWIEQGIDGWRLDVPGEINDDAFWLEFHRRVKQANPQAYLVGENLGRRAALDSGRSNSTRP